MEYAVWSDGFWCESSEIEERLLSGWSDDYFLTDEIPEGEEYEVKKNKTDRNRIPLVRL